MTPFWALVRKELAVLFGSPVAYLVLTTVSILTAITFFEHLRLYNHQLFLYASSSMAGFETDTIPDYINLRDTVFYPVMEQLGLLLLIPLPLVTMGVFARERDMGTDELLLTCGLPGHSIVAAKFLVTFIFITLMMVASFLYPTSAILQGGVGLQHLFAVFVGLLLLAFGIASIGLVCSAFTRSLVIAAASTVAVAYLLYDFGWSHGLVGEGAAALLDHIALHPHYSRFSAGLVSLGDIAYFAALALAAAAIVNASLSMRRVSP